MTSREPLGGKESPPTLCLHRVENDQGRIVDGESLFGGRREIDIRFGQSVYRLRITRQGKLILNK